MLTIAEIAARYGVSKQAVSKRVQRFIAQHDLPVERDEQGRVLRVDVEAFDRLRARYGDPAKAQALSPSSPPDTAPPAVTGGASDDSLDEAKRQQAWLAVEKERDARAERRKLLLPRDEYLAAVKNAGIVLGREIDLLAQEADAVAAEMGSENIHGARVALKRLANLLRRTVAGKIDALAAAIPPIEDEETTDDLPKHATAGL